MILDVVRASNRAGVRAMAVVTVVMTWKSVMRLGASRGDAVRDVARFLCAWAMTYYGLLFNQSGAAFEEAARLRAQAKKDGARPPKMYEVKYSRGGVTSREVLCADRTVGNFMEQSLALVPALLRLRRDARGSIPVGVARRAMGVRCRVSERAAVVHLHHGAQLRVRVRVVRRSRAVRGAVDVAREDGRL